MEKIGKGVLILPSYPERLLSNDTNHKYRQHSDLIYFTSFPEPNTVAVIENTGDNIIYHLFVPKRDKLHETWNGKRYGVEGALTNFGVDKAYTIDDLENQLPGILKNYKCVHYTDDINETFDLILKKSIKKARNEKEHVDFGPICLINPVPLIHQQRFNKSTEEIELIRKVAKISADALSKAIAVTKPGMNEYEIEAFIEFEFRKNGCARAAYPTICGSGENATILHYIENSSVLNDGDLLLVDAGGEYQSYCADITRTWPVNGNFTEPQKEIYKLVLDIQKSCIQMVKPGLLLGDIQKKSIEMITEGLIKLRLLEGTIEENITEKKYRKFFMHGIGHWLGLDVHDTSLIDKEKVSLKPGHYFTIEPGIYIPNEEDITPEKYRGIGIRIEDDILVTKSGYEIMTKDVVKEIDEIERLVGTAQMI